MSDDHLAPASSSAWRLRATGSKKSWYWPKCSVEQLDGYLETRLRFSGHRELIILRTVHLAGGAYEFTQHRPMALACGLTPAQIDAVGDWRSCGMFDVRQRAVLSYADEMMARDVSDATFARLAAEFDAREIVELTLTGGYYAAASAVTAALGIH